MSSQEFLVESNGQRSLAGYSLKGRRKSDTTEWLNTQVSRALLPRWHVVKNLPTNVGDTRDPGLIPGSGRSPGVQNGNHASILAWRIPWTEEPQGLQSMGLQRVGHDRACMHYITSRALQGPIFQSPALASHLRSFSSIQSLLCSHVQQSQNSWELMPPNSPCTAGSHPQEMINGNCCIN